MFPLESKIMVIDDSSFARSVVKTSLNELKYMNVLEADTAQRAQELLNEAEKAKSPIAVLICDIHMPNMTGIELLKWVRGQEIFKAMPVIILTASQERAEILEAGKLGASHFLIKPFTTAILKERLDSTWTKHGQKWLAK
jgi:two-component system chemotaxis response regulator CheY